MAHLMDLESRLKRIREACGKAFEESGRVDKPIITQQANALKDWVYDFENVYVQEARRKPRDAESIGEEGKELVGEAWFGYELLLEVAQRAGEPPRPADYERQPSGIVSGELKTETIAVLTELEHRFEEFRKKSLKT